ncbi:hypothetical protein GEMRC1_004911 [Eukaryota sp. GEM-RC1]
MPRSGGGRRSGGSGRSRRSRTRPGFRRSGGCYCSGFSRGSWKTGGPSYSIPFGKRHPSGAGYVNVIKLSSAACFSTVLIIVGIVLFWISAYDESLVPLMPGSTFDVSTFLNPKQSVHISS